MSAEPDFMSAETGFLSADSGFMSAAGFLSARTEFAKQKLSPATGDSF